MIVDYIKLISANLLLILITLFIIFRTMTGVVAPFVITLATLISTFGLMALFDTPVQLPTLMLPSLLIVMSIVDSIHILTIFFFRVRLGDDKVSAISFALAYAGVPIFYTTLTTAGAFASLAFSDLAPVADIGLFGPVGVIFALIYTVVLLPPLVALGSVENVLASQENPFSTNLLLRISRFSVRHPRLVLSVTLALSIMFAASFPNIRLTHNELEWIPQGSEVKRAISLIDTKLSGTESLEILIDLGKRDEFREPVNLHKLQRVIENISRVEHENVRLTKVISLIDVVKELNRALNENRPEAYLIPDNWALISQELLLFENSGRSDLEQMVNTGFSRVRLTLLVNKTDALYYGPFLDKVNRVIEEEFSQAKITMTGTMVINSHSFTTLLSSMARSYLLLFVFLVPLMMLLVKNFKMGCISMVPNFLPIIFCVGLMVLLGVRLNIMDMLVGGIVIGVIVDDTIHFIHHFKQHYAQTGSVDKAVTSTVETTGRAIFFTTAILVLSGLLDGIATMPIFATFGYFLSMIIAAAFFSDIVLMPALVRVFYKDV